MTVSREFKGFGNPPLKPVPTKPAESKPEQTLEEWAWSDISSSFPGWLKITARRLYNLNIRIADDDYARAEFELSRTALLSKSDSVKRKGETLSDGIWFTYGENRDGSQGSTIYAKTMRPRTYVEGGKIKIIKYETKYGDQALPILLSVDQITAAEIFEYYKAEPLPGESFWQTVWRCGLPIAICEGVKKALCLIAHGIPAIALRGVDCGFKKGTTELHDAIADFATADREIYIIFDQDSKPKTIKNVSRAIAKLGRAFKARGCKVKVPIWTPSLGKGIDDVLVAQGDNSQDWLDRLIDAAPGFDEWCKSINKSQLLSVLRQLNSLGIKPERFTEGRYLPELPELEQGALYIVDAAQGTGKTERIGQDWVRQAIQQGWNVLVITSRNSLGAQTANRFGLPHTGEFDQGNSDQYSAFLSKAFYEHGLACCFDSLHRIPDSFIRERPLLVILDEVNQGLSHLIAGGTLQDRQSDILERFQFILETAGKSGAIVASEDGVYHRSVDLIKALSGVDRVRLFKHEVAGQRWNCRINTGSLGGFYAKSQEALKQGKKLFIVASSLNQSRKLSRFVEEIVGKTVLRIDSETNQCGQLDAFLSNPDEYLKALPELPDVLICSPSVMSGVSITIPGFDSIWGIFTCHAPAMWHQMLGRYRLPVNREIYCKRFIPATSYEESLCSTSRIRNYLTNEIVGYRKVFAIADTGAIETESEDEQRFIKIQNAYEQFYSEDQAAIGIQKSYPIEWLTELLENSGHDVTLAKVESDKLTSEILEEIQEKLWREDAAAIANAEVPAITPAQAREVLDSGRASTVRLLEARKVLLREEFEGVEFNDSEECYQALKKDFGAMLRGVRLQSKAANLDAARPIEAEQVGQILSKKVKAAHRLPKAFFKAALINQIGILSLLDGVPYIEDDPRIVAIRQKALHWANDIAKYFVLNVKASQTGIEIANKLLRRLGLKAEILCKKGKRGQQVKTWGIPDLCNPVRIKLLEALYSKQGSDLSTICRELPASYHEAVAASAGAEFGAESDFENKPDELDPDLALELELALVHEPELENEGGWSWEVDDD